MTKTYALKRLLEHGAMTVAEIIECTGWESPSVYKTISKCVQFGLIERIHKHGVNKPLYVASTN